MKMDEFIREAQSRMAADGVVVENPVVDGKIHRCAISGKRGSSAGAYLIHADDMPVCWWRNWISNIEGTYAAKSEKELTRKERKAFAVRMAAMKEAARKEQEARWNEAAKNARKIWAESRPADGGHGYLKLKGVEAYGLRVDSRGRLLVPVMDGDGNLMSLQRIWPEKPKDGPQKPFLSGGKTAGGFYPLPARDGSKDGPLLIAEGYATAASLHASTGHAVLVAFSAGNLEAVAKMARAKYPERKIVLCADYDLPNPPAYPENGGTGVALARKAALAIGGCLAICPPFEGRDKADFNDLHAALGSGRVGRDIEKALLAGPLAGCPVPDGFQLVPAGKRAGLYRLETRADGSTEEIRLGPPLDVLAETRDADSEAWGLYLRWHDNDGREHVWAMPKTLLYMQHGEWFARLAHGGWHGNPACRKWIAAFLADVRPVKRIRCVGKTGWQGDCFVLPNAVYGACAYNEELVLQSLSHDGLYETGGSYGEWLEAARLCAGNSRLGFALAVAFTGPLLRLADIEGGAFSFEGGSSCGKTTACHIAASVWGGASHVRSWRATDNALESVAAVHNDNLLVLDEIGQVRARALDEAVYMLANGAGKARAGRDGGLRRQYRWQAVIISSGELGLADKLAEDGRRARAGQDVRFCGIPVEKSHISDLHGLPDAGALARQVKAICAANYGHAGRMFLERLCVPECLEQARSSIHKGVETLVEAMCPQNADGQVRRVALRFALVAIAGDMARSLGVLPDDFEAAEYVRDCFEAWLDHRGGASDLESAAILAQVRLFIEQHGQSRFQDWDSPNSVVVNRVGYRRDGKYYCFPESFKSEIIKGYSLKQALTALGSAGWLKKQGKVYQCVEDLPDGRQRRMYVVNIPNDKNEN